MWNSQKNMVVTHPTGVVSVLSTIVLAGCLVGGVHAAGGVQIWFEEVEATDEIKPSDVRTRPDLLEQPDHPQQLSAPEQPDSFRRYTTNGILGWKTSANPSGVSADISAQPQQRSVEAGVRRSARWTRIERTDTANDLPVARDENIPSDSQLKQRRSTARPERAMVRTASASAPQWPLETNDLSTPDEWDSDVETCSASQCCETGDQCTNECDWCFQWLPEGLLYKSYLAGEKEPRFAAIWLNDSERDLYWETALGGRVGIFRKGTFDPVRPEGWQLDLEGAALARVNLDNESDLDAADFRIGMPMTWRRGPTAVKFGYYHISSHLGDEYLIKNPTFQRRNYVRDAALVGISQDLNDDCRVYGEVAYSPGATGGAEPLEFQFGAEYSPNQPRLAPFAAVNLHSREEFDFQASVNVVAGWQVRGDHTGRRMRFGAQYYNGKALQYSFFDRNEKLAGAGLWFDY